MDRLNTIHRVSRVQLPTSVIKSDRLGGTNLPKRRLLPVASYYVGIVGFLACGAAVIASAGFLAWSIQ